MVNILDYNLKELTEIVESLEEPKYRAKQLFEAVFSGKDFSDKINLPESFIEKMKQKEIIMQAVKIYKCIKGKDKTTKLLYKLLDGNIIEGVIMHYKYGNTICISTQVGCKMNCAFCASGLNGFVRNLTVGEILGQIVVANKMLGGTLKDRKITNIVLMGSGEPLDNYANVLKFLSIITSEDSFNFSVRNISVSTCGLPTKIEELADSGYSVTLCLSLHAPNDEIRKTIMPIAKSYSIASLIESLKYYNTITNRRIIIEYILISGVNDSLNYARMLATTLKELPCHVNLIKLNEVEGRNLKTPSLQQCEKFLALLNRLGVSATLRRSLGDDVEGACGQLRNKEIKNNKLVNYERGEQNNDISSYSNTKITINTEKNMADAENSDKKQYKKRFSDSKRESKFSLSVDKKSSSKIGFDSSHKSRSKFFKNSESPISFNRKSRGNNSFDKNNLERNTTYDDGPRQRSFKKDSPRQSSYYKDGPKRNTTYNYGPRRSTFGKDSSSRNALNRDSYKSDFKADRKENSNKSFKSYESGDKKIYSGKFTKNFSNFKYSDKPSNNFKDKGFDGDAKRTFNRPNSIRKSTKNSASGFNEFNKDKRFSSKSSSSKFSTNVFKDFSKDKKSYSRQSSLRPFSRKTK